MLWIVAIITFLAGCETIDSLVEKSNEQAITAYRDDPCVRTIDDKFEKYIVYTAVECASESAGNKAWWALAVSRDKKSAVVTMNYEAQTERLFFGKTAAYLRDGKPVNASIANRTTKPECNNSGYCWVTERASFAVDLKDISFNEKGNFEFKVKGINGGEILGAVSLRQTKKFLDFVRPIFHEDAH